MSSHFSSVLYFVHSINLYGDPALGSIHLCLTSGKSSPGGLFLFFSFFPPMQEKKNWDCFLDNATLNFLPPKPNPPSVALAQETCHVADIPSSITLFLQFLVLILCICNDAEAC